MALYDIVSGTTAVASDVEQLVNIFNGKHDIGNISLAPQISSPSSSSFSLASQSGSSLGVGAYNYEFTYVTGQYKSDGVTLVQTGETPVSSNLSITTTSGNTTVKVTLPTSGLPTSAIAINIYRTSVGGSDYKLVATVKAGSANYTDSTADASRGSQVPPTSNTTGTMLSAQNPYFYYVGGQSGIIGSSGTLNQFPVSGSIGLGMHLSSYDVVIDSPGKYVLECTALINGLNALASFDLLIRVVHTDNSYGDDVSYVIGFSGAGGNYYPQGVLNHVSVIKDLKASDKVQFYCRCSEAPRNINAYWLKGFKISQ
jgi:hypothetical protein